MKPSTDQNEHRSDHHQGVAGTQVRVDPPLNRWDIHPSVPPHVAQIRNQINPLLRAKNQKPLDVSRPILATGHQAWHWHPGILAKYLAAADVARRVGAQIVNIVVDQDPSESLRWELPLRAGDELSVSVVELGRQNTAAPTGSHPAIDPARVVKKLTEEATAAADRLPVDLNPVIAAWENAPTDSSLADQVAAVLARLMEPYVGDVPTVMASDLLQTATAESWIERMLHEAVPCVTAYNQAVSAYPEAQVGTLRVERDRIELPLWFMDPAPEKEMWPGDQIPPLPPRQRVFADVAGTEPILVLENGHPAPRWQDGPGWSIGLAPRALFLTALARTHFCDLFVHGTGGERYDRVTEQWWRNWIGTALAPRATVSADLYLNLDAPIADRRQLDRAVWWTHHLPHNIDRVLPDTNATPEDLAAIQRKKRLIGQMDHDRNRRRRAEAFAQIHQINHRLGEAHPDLLRQAQHQLRRTRQGVANRRIALKRDWCFALYPPEQLKRLQRVLAGSDAPA